MSKTGESKS
ncbi:hypothetical protein CFP56_006323 [Quercus suber]|uniref:Uncharacterized protein n=1 Tax=Quercus suber TaxID=58331 RepID=A0AAW0LA16_QUESU